jgi:hypothetical protein
MAGLLLRKDSAAGPGGGPATCRTRGRGSRSGCAYSCVLLIALLASAWIRIAKELCKETCLVNHTDGLFAAPSMQGSNSNV